MRKMKKNRLLCGVICAALTLFLSACSNKTDKKTNIAVIVKATDSDFWHNVKNGVDFAATEYNVSVSFDGPKNEEDYNAQNIMIKNAVDRGVDAIVFSAIDFEKSAGALTDAARAGVKIVTIDSGSASPQVSMFIGTDNIEAGRSAGRAAISGFAPESNIHIGILNYYKSTDNGMKREEGFREYIDTVPNAEITALVNVDSNIESASAGAKALINENPQINVLVGFNEWMTLGVGNAIRDLNLSDKVRSIGFDTNTVSIGMLETGEMDALIIQNPFAIGYLGVENVAELVSGEGGEKNDIYTTVTTVTKDNLFDKDIQKILFSFNHQ